MTTEEKRKEIAKMLDWQYFESKHSFWENSIGERFILLEFDTNANWQFEALDWVDKQPDLCGRKGHYETRIGMWMKEYSCSIEFHVQTGDASHRIERSVNIFNGKSRKEAIFEALFQFSQYLK